MLSIKTITPQIILVKAPTQVQLGATFLRFQEYYESPEFKDTIFTEGQFRKWYSEKYGANTYEIDWTGFNIPGSVFDPFIKGLFNPLSDAEKELVDLFRYRTDKFYVIGAQDGNPETLEHEICHGLYYTNREYALEVNRVISDHRSTLNDSLDPVYNYIASLMYHPSVHDDEVHAWVSANSEDLKKLGVTVPDIVVEQLQAIREKYFTED